LFEVNELNIFEYWYLLRDATIYNLSQTEKGQEYLDTCWRLTQTKAVDADKLIKKYKGG